MGPSISERSSQPPFDAITSLPPRHTPNPAARPIAQCSFSSSSQRNSASIVPPSPAVINSRINDRLGEQLTDDVFDQVIVAIDTRDSGTVGCSYYSAREEKLYMLGDMQSSGTDIIDTIIFQTKPTVILASPRVEYLHGQGRLGLDIDESSDSYLPYQIDVRPSQEFGHASAISKLVSLDISSRHEEQIRFLVPHAGLVDADHMDTESLDFTLQEGRILHMGGSIEIQNTVTMGCAGAILTHLQRRRATMSSGNGTIEIFRIASVEMVGLKGTMFVNSRTLLSLQIMESESHPCMINQGSGTKSSSAKEGLSVFGLFQRFAFTPQGKNLLKQYFLRPSTDMKVICERHSFISVYLRPDNFNALNKIVKSLKHIKNLRYVMINLRKGISTGSGKITGFKTTVWATLLAFAFYGIDIHDALKETSGGAGLELHQKALRALEAAQLYLVGRMIQEIVDIDSSEEQGRTVVKPGLDRELDKMKDTYDGLSSLLKKVAIEIAKTIPESLEIDVNVIYFPQLGFNIAIPLTERGEAAYAGPVDDWELIFVTENRAYFKDFRMREMDQTLGDIYGLICEREIEITYELAQKVLQYKKVLIEASDICGQVDSVLAMAQAASFYKLVRPKMTEENILRIEGGRHILQELTVSSYVPNDTLLVGGELDAEASGSSNQSSMNAPNMLLLTGPNYSGKSVYMKQVALVIYLAQIGSFVPAESAEVGITDKILLKSNTQDSVSQIQSTFMNDLQQISFDLKQVTGRSLLLIDEFGKGTNTNGSYHHYHQLRRKLTNWTWRTDGIGLACGVLEHLLGLEDAPKIIFATHFHEILNHELIKLGPRLQLAHMEIRICEDARENGDQITYLYNFRLGRSSKSFGTVCAAMNGISQPIVDRANELVSLATRGENLVAACAMLSAEETSLLEKADKLARAFLGLDLSDEGHSNDADRVLDRLFEEVDT
ncbi:DNA mismatch repair protein Msh5 [Aspergillus steynii IBT 23096]|uniref:DNA mismatch repair protein Msh5 n=1 Tax=Aspergillus steynii IBT 23096 TaxID=1392250 RepID=A0A2I2FT14_9EURO|nr:DNA mismatch repair protein Msh5 [Aspergillus steynii IBT 23096]PLB43783.1 DNA mismatch repair protein Msh5 [Aspergillus steynii IBT 23096]